MGRVPAAMHKGKEKQTLGRALWNSEEQATRDLTVQVRVKLVRVDDLGAAGGVVADAVEGDEGVVLAVVRAHAGGRVAVAWAKTQRGL